METKFNKKAQIGKKLTGVLTIIITIVILFNLFSSLMPEVQSAGTELQDSDICAESGCFFNSTLTPSCVINSSQEGTGFCQNDFNTIPLSSLFSSTGVVVLLLMVFLLIGVLRLALPSRK